MQAVLRLHRDNNNASVSLYSPFENENVNQELHTTVPDCGWSVKIREKKFEYARIQEILLSSAFLEKMHRG